VIYSAKVFDLVKRACEFGIQTGSTAIDMLGVRERKRKMVEGDQKFHWDMCLKTGAEVVQGEGRFVEPRTIEIQLTEGGARRLTAKKIFLNLGSRAAMPGIPGLSEAQPLTHVGALELGRLPEHLILLGGGYVGLELGQAFKRFGSRVTVIERGDRILSQEDPDVSAEVLRLFRDEGIDVRLDLQVEKVMGRSGQNVTIECKGKRGTEAFAGSDLLVALGRTPNTRDLGLDIANVQLDPAGFIRVNDRMETSVADIWALGDCAGRPFFTHIAFDDYRTVWGNLTGGNRSTKGRLVPSTVFIDPPLAHVGLKEVDAQKNGQNYRVFQGPITLALRTSTVSEPRGFMKMLVDSASDRILGFTALGYEAGELMAVVETAMMGNLPYTALRDAVFAHPTMAEGLVALLSQKAVARSTAKRVA
jgi:pyruvate/2-oxoglutarate dehydrogenase complex dihydrolipoamide dehydrogenase (E3) component